ncbi:sensor histidine kinase [Plantactinospora veratri]|uniref:histidine kinase n=1 Tax=Plantactinospora veratri TaxID=1436122 RepID=A0ABU7SDU1_9ACTN
MDVPGSGWAGRAGARYLFTLDALVAIGYVTVLLLLRHTQSVEPAATGVPGPAVDLMIVTTGLPLAVRRRWPLPVLVVVLVMSLLAVPLNVLNDPFLAPAYALYPVSLAMPRRLWVPVVVAVALAVAGLVSTTPATGQSHWWLGGPGLIVVGWLLIGASWTLGNAARQQRDHAARVAEQRAQQAVTRERLRIARELHDVVAHSVGLIAVKAAVANYVVRTRPEEAGEALQVIEAASRTALTEMRHMLGVLRAEDSPAQPATERAPVPGPANLPALAEQAAMAGLRVELILRGVERMSEALGLTVYRIVQESLTNAAKHAAPARCRVSVDAAGSEVIVDVADDGHGRDTPVRHRDGHGLIGMRERVTMYGGSFSAGPRPEGGFRIVARLPAEPGRQPVGLVP